MVPPGGIVLFSGAQLHSTVPNTSGYTRYSIDFRTVNLDDVIDGLGAHNIDNASTGTSLRDFKRASDFADMSEAVVERYDIGPKPADGGARLRPGLLGTSPAAPGEAGAAATVTPLERRGVARAAR